MIYIGNFKDWIDDKWIQHIQSVDGIPRPKTASENPDCEEFELATQAGYDITKTWWYHYSVKNFPFLIGNPPWDQKRNCLWWFIKMKPGGYMPMHKDPHIYNQSWLNCRRFWIAVQDYEPGHIFLSDDLFLSNYNIGDVWEYDSANDLHGACNIGYNNRISFLITTYDLAT